MNVNESIVTSIKNNDSRRIAFFVDKLRTDLKKYGFVVSDLELEKLLIEETNKFDVNSKGAFYFNIFRNIKEKLATQNNVNLETNEFFSEIEMIVANYYLTNLDEEYYSKEEISKKLGISIIEVIKITDKLKSLFVSDTSRIVELFDNVKRLELETNRFAPTPKIKKMDNSWSDEDLEILGLYTGQIDDICLDIDVIAKKYEHSPSVITCRLRTIFESLSDKNNYNLVLSTYPNILSLLSIKARSLDVDPVTFVSLKKKETEKVKHIRKATKNTNNSGKKRGRTTNYAECVKLLKYLYKPKEDGSYYSISELANDIYSTKANNLYQRKSNILSRFEKDESFRNGILILYPEFIDDKNNYENSKKTTPDYSNSISEYVEFLKLIYKPNEDGSYNSFSFISDKLKIKENTLKVKKSNLLRRINASEEFKNIILELYPEFLVDKKKYEEINGKRKIKNKTSNSSKTDEYINLLKIMYKPQENGYYYSVKEIAEICEVHENTIRFRKNKALWLLNDENFIKILLVKYPEFYDDKKKYEESKNKVVNPHDFNLKIDRYVEFLKAVYKKNENDKYNSFIEIGEMFVLNKASVKNKLRIITDYFNSNEVIRNAILEKYPEFLEDKKNFEEVNNNVKTRKKTFDLDYKRKKAVAYSEFLKLAYKPKEDGTYYTNNELGLIYNMHFNSIYMRKKNIFEHIQRDEEICDFVLELYPEFFEDKKKYDNLDRKVNKKSIVKGQLAKVQKYVDFLKLYYSPKEDGTYRNIEEIALEWEIEPKSVYNRRRTIFDAMESDEILAKQILELYPDLLKNKISQEEFFNNLNQDKKEQLSDDEIVISNSLFKNVTREIISNKAMAIKMNISADKFGVLKFNALRKIKSSSKLQEDYPTAEKEDTIRTNHRVYEKFILSEDNLKNIKNNARKYDIPNMILSNTKDELLNGMVALTKSIYKDYALLCTNEQKAILALRLGFYNNTIFSSSDIAELFSISVEEVDFLTDECLKLCSKDNDDKEKELKLI